MTESIGINDVVIADRVSFFFLLLLVFFYVYHKKCEKSLFVIGLFIFGSTEHLQIFALCFVLYAITDSFRGLFFERYVIRRFEMLIDVMKLWC